MKSSLFDILLSLFENSVSTNKKKNKSLINSSTLKVVKEGPIKTEFVKTQNSKSKRIFNIYEQLKFTENSFKILMFLFNSETISHDLLELIIDKLLCSKSSYGTFEQVKDTIFSTLTEKLDSEQLAFLDLLFYQQEDGCSFH